MDYRWALVLFLGIACSDKDNGDDDSSGGESGESGESGSAGKGGSGSGGTATGGSATGGSTTGGTATGGSATGGGATGGSATGGSATGGSGAATTGGSGGAGATSGTAGQGGSGGDAQGATGGDAGQAGDAGQGGAGATGGSGGDGPGGTGGTGGSAGHSGETPLVVLLLDGSSSMFENGMWDAVYASLITDGVLAGFAGKVDLGLSVFRGNAIVTTETDPSCAIMTDLDFSTDNGDEIEDALVSVGGEYMETIKWETPTGFAIRHAGQQLAAVTTDADKYILLVTDGAPNTCATLDPQCGEDTSISAVQEVRGLGIRTVPVGLEPILDVNSGCPVSARCGVDHLQDLANAGTGKPVEPADTYYNLEPCVIDHLLIASYAEVGGGGDATYYVSTNDGGLTGELNKALQAIVDGDVP